MINAPEATVKPVAQAGHAKQSAPKADAGQAIFEAVGLLVATGISGLVFGYLFYKTDNLWRRAWQ